MEEYPNSRMYTHFFAWQSKSVCMSLYKNPAASIEQNLSFRTALLNIMFHALVGRFQ